MVETDTFATASNKATQYLLLGTFSLTCSAMLAVLFDDFQPNRLENNSDYPFEISPPSERRYRVLLKPRKSLKIRQFIHVKAL